MTREEAKEYIHERGKEYATEAWGRDKSGKGWVCPICGSGSGDKGTGITTKDGIHFTCWVGCFTNADVIDIIGEMEHITEYPAKLEAAAREFGLSVDEPARQKGAGFRSTAADDFKDLEADDGGAQRPQTGRPLVTAPDGGEAGNLDTFFLQANKDLSKTDYHRGLSLETLTRFNVGYVERWRHPKAPQGVAMTPRLIIPTSPASYIARDTRPNIPPEQEQYKKQQVGSRGKAIFNGEALTTAKGPIFITEGELDAMSVIDVGGEAITAGSAAQWRNVFEAVKASPPAYPVIIAVDVDGVGKAEAEKLKIALGTAGIRFRTYTPPAGAKDANEALMKDRETGGAAFAESVRAAIDDALNMGKVEPEPSFLQAELTETQEEYIAARSASASLQTLIERIKTGEQLPPIPTGFDTLDKILNGGLRSGLYVLGAVQSLGKTAFVMQIMDNVAAAGHDVLIFSLEMAREELITRSISRITYALSKKAVAPGRMAYSTIELLSGSCYGKDGAAGNRRIMEAVEAYSRYADRIFISEGVGDITVERMRADVESHIRITGRRPVVVCDYLQIVPPGETAGSRTDKQQNDYNVVALKRLSRDNDLPVIVVSSFNRQNYVEPLNPSAFKETGAIEYSADVLIGLQLRGMEYRPGDEKEAQRARRVAMVQRGAALAGKMGKPQGIHVKIMKNRTGYKDGVYFSYYPAFNYFECDTDADEKERKNDDEWAQTVENEVRASRKSGGGFY